MWNENYKNFCCSWGSALDPTFRLPPMAGGHLQSRGWEGSFRSAAPCPPQRSFETSPWAFCSSSDPKEAEFKTLHDFNLKPGSLEASAHLAFLLCSASGSQFPSGEEEGGEWAESRQCQQPFELLPYSPGLCLPWCGIDRTGPYFIPMCTSTRRSWRPCRCAQVDTAFQWNSTWR